MRRFGIDAVNGRLSMSPETVPSRAFEGRAPSLHRIAVPGEQAKEKKKS
jgi:hypothetical protein